MVLRSVKATTPPTLDNVTVPFRVVDKLAVTDTVDVAKLPPESVTRITGCTTKAVPPVPFNALVLRSSA